MYAMIVERRDNATTCKKLEWESLQRKLKLQKVEEALSTSTSITLFIASSWLVRIMPSSVKYTVESLDKISYKQIQAIAKEKGIASNQKKSTLIKAIVNAQKNDLFLDFVEETVDENKVESPLTKQQEEEKDVPVAVAKEEETNMVMGNVEEKEGTSNISKGSEASESMFETDFNIKKSSLFSSSSSSSLSS